jgi:hypothetical protein
MFATTLELSTIHPVDPPNRIAHAANPAPETNK